MRLALLALFALGCGDEFNAYRSRGLTAGASGSGSADASAEAGSGGEGGLGIRDTSSFPCEIGSRCDYTCPNGAGLIDLCTCAENQIGLSPCMAECQELLVGERESPSHFELCGWPESGMGCQYTSTGQGVSEPIGDNCQPTCVTGADCESGCCVQRAGVSSIPGSADQYLCQPVGYVPGATNSQCVE